MKYRVIAEYDKASGYVDYVPQYKSFLFWNNFCIESSYEKSYTVFDNPEKAKAFIRRAENMYNKAKKYNLGEVKNG